MTHIKVKGQPPQRWHVIGSAAKGWGLMNESGKVMYEISLKNPRWVMNLTRQFHADNADATKDQCIAWLAELGAERINGVWIRASESVHLE